ncbi:MAG: hypothetical protein ACYSR9_01755 [Planctomycetota bacterium]|jgi:hypothetical protein
MMSLLHRITEARKAITLKTLRITGIIAVASVAILFAVPALFGVHHDEKVEQFLNSPGAIEKFNKAKADKPAGSHEQISPLIKQAEAFALYLNPPAKRKPKTTKPSRARREEPRPKGPVSSKFELIGTSYYELRPDLSLALIDEPGKGVNWVRQSGKVGHLIIEDIKDALVVVRDGKKTFELTCERPKKTSLVKKAPPRSPPITSRHAQPPPPPPPLEISTEEVAALTKEQEEFMAQEAARAEEIFAELEAMRVTPEEASTLGSLGRKLQKSRRDANSTEPNNAQTEPNIREAISSEPNSPE